MLVAIEIPIPLMGTELTEVLRRLECISASDAVWLVAGEVASKRGAEKFDDDDSSKFDCKRPSMCARRSRMSLSPASNFTPGSRYTHSALSSVQSLHFGRAPLHLDFLLRQTSQAIVARRLG